MISVSSHDMSSAQSRWNWYWMVNTERNMPMGFHEWTFDEKKYGYSLLHDYFTVPDEAARRIQLLAGEHWFAVLKAYEANLPNG